MNKLNHVTSSSSRANRKFNLWIFMAIVIFLPAFGCDVDMPPHVRMTSEEIAAHGTAIFQAEPDKVFRAAVDAVRVLGYEIAAERPDRGIIITERKIVGQMANVSGGRYGGIATVTKYQHQLTIELKPIGEGKTQVVVTPAAFENDTDISLGPNWDIGNARNFWQKVFGKIQMLL